MKYKSELIKEIVETRGHNLSSPHYESECVKSWIEETKEAYPKLCDYESEWLNYINEKTIGNVLNYEFLTGKYLNINNGTLINGSITHKYVDDYFAIPGGTQVITLKGENNYKKICYYDNNKQFIIGYQLSTDLLDDFTTDVPTGASYFRFNTSITVGVPGVSVNEYLHVYFDDILSMTNKQENKQ